MHTPDAPRGELLRYHPHPAPARRRWLLLPLGLVPLVMAVATLGPRDFDSDPPTLEQFKAFHYRALLCIVLSIGWFAAVACAFRGRTHRELLLLCALWCAAVCGYAGWFLHRLNEHPVAGHFRSVWFD